MAPTKPSKRTSIRDKAARASVVSNSIVSIERSHPARPSVIQPTKRDKRDARHSALLSKVTSSAAITKTSKKNEKRKEARKAAQNLSTNLHSLADALPDDDEPVKEFLVAQGLNVRPTQSNKPKMNSIKSKPGAQKKKEKVLREECERFMKNLAIIQTAAVAPGNSSTAAGVQVITQAAPAAKSVWEALRGHISNNMEKKEDFLKKEAANELADVRMEMEI